MVFSLSCGKETFKEEAQQPKSILCIIFKICMIDKINNDNSNKYYYQDGAQPALHCPHISLSRLSSNFKPTQNSGLHVCF